MRAQRVWKVVDADQRAQIEQLQLELADFNKRIAEVEKAHVEIQAVESLKVRAIELARQIDQVRCTIASEQLASLLIR